MAQQPKAVLLADVLRRGLSAGGSLSLVEAVEYSRQTGAKEHITVETVFTESDNPLALIEPTGVRCEISFAGELGALWCHDDGGEWFVAAWPSGRDHIYHLVTTVHSTNPRWKRAERWIRGSREIIQTFLDNADFEAIGISLAEFGGVEVGRVTARSVLDGSSDQRGWPAESPMVRLTPSEVLSVMHAEFYSVRTMTIHTGHALSMHLRRVAGATYYTGSFQVFSEYVLGALARAAESRRSLLLGRERRAQQPARPIRIAFASDLFGREESSHNLLQEISTLPRTSLAVFHRNPYLHVAVSDEVDGSSFDLVVTEPNSIDIYPGFRATPSALGRLSQVLADRFGASEIEDRPVESYSLADLSLG